jgi:pyrroloquinoline quinone (PQQ) biosynthesis protein C
MGASEPLIVRKSWITSLHHYVKPYWDHLIDGPWAEGIVQGSLTLSEMQGWMLQIYPFIHTFPKFLAETLIKVEDDYSRSFYINNIRVEKGHAEHWLESRHAGPGACRERRQRPAASADDVRDL